MNYSLLHAAQEMRRRINTIPVNYLNPRLCTGELETWDAAIARAEEGISLPFRMEEDYCGVLGWHVVAPFGGSVFKSKNKISANNVSISLNQIIAENREAVARLALYRDSAESFDKFLAAQPKGWLGKTFGNIGDLNQAFMKLTAARQAEGRET